ncbi:MAG: 3'(2'),5'-bisphosphate nucleotidase CysQ [Rikenellaceae bacterium]|nr:3'(2'),5'-bisphosphate nucleotidase CysQ [Rikenellaceae bacterium]
MIEQQLREYLLPCAFNAAVRAGAEIMKVYHNSESYDIKVKSDNTPLTIADRLAHNKIKEVLGSTRIPILSEEGREMLYDERKNWDMFWLIDPLDGTIEFIKGNNEFTVNIALMSENECVGAIVYVPYLGKAYFAEQGCGAMLLEGVYPDENANYTNRDIRSKAQMLPLSSATHDKFRIAVSRSHQTAETAEYVEKMRKIHPEIDIIEQGSSYKFCLMAEGAIDYYPRTTTTYEWDTAAAELILVESGGLVRSLPDHRPLRYNKEDLHNPWFECHRFM